MLMRIQCTEYNIVFRRSVKQTKDGYLKWQSSFLAFSLYSLSVAKTIEPCVYPLANGPAGTCPFEQLSKKS